LRTYYKCIKLSCSNLRVKSKQLEIMNFLYVEDLCIFLGSIDCMNDKLETNKKQNIRINFLYITFKH